MENKIINERISNAWKLAASPLLTLDDCDGKYYAGYVGDKIAIFEKQPDIPPRVIVYFPGTEDGRIASERICDSLNDPTGKTLSLDELLSSEKK